MLGSLLSSAIKIATLPVDAISITTDVIGGGNGSKSSRTSCDSINPFSTLEEIRDALAQAAKDIDED